MVDLVLDDLCRPTCVGLEPGLELGILILDLDGLVSLGYTQSEASLAVSKQDQSLSVEELIKLSLKSLARGL